MCAPTAWSIFSGLSLAEVSILSVIVMPLTTFDIAHGRYYGITSGQEETSTRIGTSSPNGVCLESIVDLDIDWTNTDQILAETSSLATP